MGFRDSTELMQRVADGDVEAFGHLYDRFAPDLTHLFVRRGANLTLADDLTQEVFISLWERRGDFRAESSFETYLFSIAKHTLNKEMRQARKVAEIDFKQHPESTMNSHTGPCQPEVELYLRELTAAVEVAKARLTAEQRQALEASQLVDMPLDKALEEVGCSHGAFKNRLKRARKRLRELLAAFLRDDETRCES